MQKKLKLGKMERKKEGCTSDKKRRLSHDNPTFSFNLKSNTMKNTVQKYCFLTI